MEKDLEREVQDLQRRKVEGKEEIVIDRGETMAIKLNGSAKYGGDIFKAEKITCAFNGDEKEIQCKLKPKDESKPHLTFEVDMEKVKKISKREFERRRR